MFASIVSKPSSCRWYACILLNRPMPLPSCLTYKMTPRFSFAICCIAVFNWKPQSHFKLNRVSPVKHSEWILARTGSLLAISPIYIAACSLFESSLKAIILKVPKGVGRFAGMVDATMFTPSL